MVACFFGKTGNVAIVPLEQRRTVKWYTTIYLPVVFQELRKTNRRRRITLQHDNGSSHTSAQTTTFISIQNIDLMSHPPYSRDLAPNNFFVFRYVNNKMRGERFSSPEEAVECMFWRYLNQSKSDSIIGSNACKSVLILMGNILKKNKVVNICFCSLIPKHKRQPSVYVCPYRVVVACLLVYPLFYTALCFCLFTS